MNREKKSNGGIMVAPEDRSETRIDLSVVIPVYNEVDSVGILAGRVINSVSCLERTFEVIFIDDGSVDGTDRELERISARFDSVKTIRFRRNYGQTAALAAGFQYASGEIIVTLDGDLQNDPQDIPKVVAKIEEGYDVVSGWRSNRQDDFLTRTLPSKIANRIIGSVSGVPLHDYGCSLKAYRAETAKCLSLYGEMHRFIPALAAIEGARIAELPVVHHPRVYGRSKYNLSKTFRVVLDLLTVVFMRRFITRPLHVFGGIGLPAFGAGMLICLYLAVDKIFYNASIGDRPLLDLGIVLSILGIQFISTGIVAEILVRTYYESQHKDVFRVKEFYGSWSNGGAKS